MEDHHTLKRLYKKDPSPCEVFNCGNVKLCTDERVACSSYRDYVIYPNRKLREPGAPSRTLFNITNNGDE